MHFLQSIVALCAITTSALAAPTSIQARQSTFEGKQLSILPLGDSITYGIGSPSSNSYRQFLLTSLEAAGATVDMVGTVQSGTMADRDNEGHPGWIIDQIAGAASSVASAGITPNVVLLHAGTNDCGLAGGCGQAHVLLGNLIDQVVSQWPEAAVVVAQIIPAQNAGTQANIDVFNSNIPDVVNARSSAGQKVSLVDMGSALNAATDLSDSLHPNDQGFEKMASVWFDGLSAAVELGWV